MYRLIQRFQNLKLYSSYNNIFFLNAIFKVINNVDKSLENLQLEYIDLVMIHFPGLPKGFRAEEKPERFLNIPRDADGIAEARMQMWEALQECQKVGKVKHIGVSNFTRHHIEQLIGNPR